LLWHWHYTSKKSSSVNCFYDQNSVHIVSEILFTYLNNSAVICFFWSEKLKNIISACYFSLFSERKKQTNNDLFKNMTRILMSKQLYIFYNPCLYNVLNSLPKKQILLMTIFDNFWTTFPIFVYSSLFHKKTLQLPLAHVTLTQKCT
jgi:hypothetical protein